MQNTTRKKILIVDDDRALLRDVQGHLEKLNYEVAIAADAQTAITLAHSLDVDLVVLDINFPGETSRKGRSLDGIDVLRALRESGNVPIVMLSSTNIPAVKVMALTMGADDYVPKPFDLHELSARIEAVLRRSRDEVRGEGVLSFRRLRLDSGERRAWKDDLPIELTGVEFDLLYTLARRPNHVFTREKLLEAAWKETSYSVPKVVDVHVGHIRQKIEDDPTNPVFIVTVRGTGYRFEDEQA